MTADIPSLPPLTSLADIEAFESVPLASRNLPANTLEVIRETVRRQPDTLAIRYIENGDKWKAARDSGETDLSRDITYGQLLANIYRAANLFRATGIGDSDVVSMVLPNVPEAHYVLWGAEAAGIVAPINHMLDASEIGEIIQSAGSKVLVVMGVHEEFDIAEKLATIRAHAPSVEHVFVVGAMPQHAEDCQSFEDALAQHADDGLTFDREVRPESIASLFHTGGTTGLPKLAQHSHSNEVYTAWALNLVLQYRSGDTNITGLPLFHCNAALASGLLSFMHGCTVLLTGINGYRSPGILSNMFHLIEHYRVIGFASVPTIIAVLSQLPTEGCDLSSLKVAGCGAAPMPVELFNKFQNATGVRIAEGYGLTEATVCSTMCPPAADPPRIGSIGLRIPYTRVKSAILDSKGVFVRDCEPDEVGIVLVNGPSVTPGYLDSSKNAALFVTDSNGDVWLNTGDLARQDNDGYFWLTGRSKELIIRGGHNIDPKSIEEVLVTHPAVNLAAAVGRPDSYAGEVPVAYVDVVSDVSEEELMEYCRQHIGERAAVPKAITIVDSLPVTGVGKIHKLTLNLMELKLVIDKELAKLQDNWVSCRVEPQLDPKLGAMAHIAIRCPEGVVESDVDAAVREALGAFSFPFTLDVSY